jgi:hypothetical protein
MDKKIKARWVKALRSGEYKQGTGYLAKKRGSEARRYCCLGVLCELAVKSGVAERVEDHTGFDERGYRGKGNQDEFRETSLPPRSVVEWAGLERSNPLLGGQNTSDHNDGTGTITRPKSFDEIADLIEEYL